MDSADFSLNARLIPTQHGGDKAGHLPKRRLSRIGAGGEIGPAKDDIAQCLRHFIADSVNRLRTDHGTIGDRHQKLGRVGGTFQQIAETSSVVLQQ